MSIIYQDIENDYIDELVIVNATTRRLLTKTKYGNINDLKMMPIVASKSYTNDLINVRDLDLISFSGKIPKNKDRAKNLFDIEEMLVNQYSNIVVVRIDTKSIKGVFIGRRTFTRMLDKLSKKIHKRKDRDLSYILAMVYGIEPDRYGLHFHDYFFLDGNRYINLNTGDRIELFKEDINKIIDLIYKVMDSFPVLNYTKINIVDLGTEDKNVIIINKNDIIHRNCLRVWLTYICKFNKNIRGKSYGKSIFVKKKMIKDKDNDLLLWYNNKNELVVEDDIVSMNLRLKGVKYHRDRISQFFAFEDEVASHYEKYVMIPIKWSGNINHSAIPVFLKRYNSNRLFNKVFINGDIGYCWTVNDIDENIDYCFYLFFSIDDYDYKTRDNIVDIVNGWWCNATKLTEDLLDKSILEDLIIVNSNDYKDRNLVRYYLTTMNVTQNEDKDMSPRNYRLFSKSKVKVRNK